MLSSINKDFIIIIIIIFNTGLFNSTKGPSNFFIIFFYFIFFLGGGWCGVGAGYFGLRPSLFLLPENHVIFSEGLKPR